MTVVTSCCQLLQAVASFDNCYKLLPVLTAVTSCCQHWQLLQAVASIDRCYQLLPALTVFISRGQLWLVLYVGASFDSCYKLLPALTAVTCCLQLWQLLQALKYLIPSLRVNSLSPAFTAVTAVASFASCYKLLAAKPLFHFNINTAWIFDSVSKGQFIPSSTRSWHQFQKVVSEWVSQWVSHWLG